MSTQSSPAGLGNPAEAKSNASTGNDAVLPQAATSVQEAQDALRVDFIHESLGLAAIQIHLAQSYLEIGDRVGFSYAMRSLLAYIRAAAPTAREWVGTPAETAGERQ